jgi:hypothetical protein
VVVDCAAAWDAIEREAAAIRTAQPDLTREAAVAEAMQRRPELYRSYVRAP